MWVIFKKFNKIQFNIESTFSKHIMIFINKHVCDCPYTLNKNF